MPIDLENAEIPHRVRGYDCAQVDRLLNGAAKTLQEVLIENVSLRNEVERLRSRVDASQEQDQTIKEVLVLAQRAADETRSAAQRQADAILNEARQSAAAERMAEQQKLSEVRWEIERLRADRSRLENDLRVTLERYLRELSPREMPQAA